MREINLDMDGCPILEVGDIVESFNGNKYEVIKNEHDTCVGCDFQCNEFGNSRGFNCEANNVKLVLIIGM